jgi:hypothetical protein
LVGVAFLAGAFFGAAAFFAGGALVFVTRPDLVLLRTAGFSAATAGAYGMLDLLLLRTEVVELTAAFLGAAAFLAIGAAPSFRAASFFGTATFFGAAPFFGAAVLVAAAAFFGGAAFFGAAAAFGFATALAAGFGSFFASLVPPEEPERVVSMSDEL